MGNNLKLISAIELVILLNQGYVITTKNLASHFCSVKQDGMEFEIFIKWQDKSLPDLEELKKEFIEKIASYLYQTTYTREREEGESFGQVEEEKESESKIWAESIWQFIEENTVPKSEVEKDIAEYKGLLVSAHKDLIDLKAENEKLKERFRQQKVLAKKFCDAVGYKSDQIDVELKSFEELLITQARSEKLGYFIFKDACGERVNKNTYDKYDGFKQVLPIETDRIKAEAREDTIKECVSVLRENREFRAVEILETGLPSPVIEPQQLPDKVRDYETEKELAVNQARKEEGARIIQATESLEHDYESGEITEIIDGIEKLIEPQQPSKQQPSEEKI